MDDILSLLNRLQKQPKRNLNDHIVLIDGMNTLIRSFSVIKSINPEGHHIGGLTGFLKSVGFIVRILQPTRVVVVWDGKGGAGNRQRMNSEYKAQRANSTITNWGLYNNKAEEQESLTNQLYRIQDYLECLPVHEIMLEKLEADDIIAYIAKQGSRGNKKITIVSSDMDFLQLVDENIQVYSPIKKKTVTYKNAKDVVGVVPENYNILKALVGDSSDNIKGVKGAGIKTIVKEFPLLASDDTLTLDYIYGVCEQHLNEDKKCKKIFTNIVHNWDRVENNYKVMSLHETMVSEREARVIKDILETPVPQLRIGPFLQLLTADKIDGITQNTEGWLSVFSNLASYSKY